MKSDADPFGFRIFFDPGDIDRCWVKLQPMPGNPGQGACWAYYLPQLDSFWLMNDAQTAPLGSVVAGSNGSVQNSQCKAFHRQSQRFPVRAGLFLAASVQNSQCTLNGFGSSASGSGTDLTVVMSLTFKPTFAGAKNVFLYSQDVGWEGAGWSPLASWIVN